MPDKQVPVVRKSNKRGFSVMISITGFAEAGKHFVITKDAEKIILTPTEPGV